MPSRPPPGENIELLVGVVARVARMHGSRVSLADLVQLLPSQASGEDVARALQSSPKLANEYVLQDGFVLPRAKPGLPVAEDDRGGNTAANVRLARWLASRLAGDDVRVLAVSGSTSYGAASRRDDVDLFCVVRPGSMWTFLARALLLTRASRLSGRDRSPICLSCVMDSDYADSLFRSDRGALFARDALVAEVILGQDEYGELLRCAPWMKRYFPRLYNLRGGGKESPSSGRLGPSGLQRFADRFLFVTLGSYISAKARLHNLSLARQGKRQAWFRARVGLDHLIYESAKYTTLKQMYGEIRPSGQEGLEPLPQAPPPE
jgi:hypothetical protein